MMTYDEFGEHVRDHIFEFLPEYENLEVNVNTFYKNNDYKRDGLCIRNDESISPVIYLDKLYDKYDEEKDLNKAMMDIADIYREHAKSVGDRSEIVNTILNNPEEAKGRIFSKIVNTEANKELLSNRPHKNVEDLSLVYQVLTSHTGDGIESIAVTYDMAEKMGMSLDDLDTYAMENNSKLFPMKFVGMSEILMGFMDPEMSEDLGIGQEDEMMYILTNEPGVFGATYMSSPEALAEVAEKIDDDLVILPSSIHEVIILPVSQTAAMDMQSEEGLYELKEMVSQINGDVVSPEDILSNNVYRYDAKEHKLSLATPEIEHEQVKTQQVEKNIRRPAMAH